MSTLDGRERSYLLQVARRAIAMALRGAPADTRKACTPALEQPRATFVTLRCRATDALRGCRGEVKAVHSLVASVARTAVCSATDDPRFPPVQQHELTRIRIHISALTPLTSIQPEEIELGRHGLMIVASRRSGLLLPEVPAHYGLATRQDFLAAVCRKAGLPEEAWAQPGTRLFGFEAECWGEAD